MFTPKNIVKELRISIIDDSLSGSSVNLAVDVCQPVCLSVLLAVCLNTYISAIIKARTHKLINGVRINE